MAVVETWLKSDLKKPITVKQLPGALFLGDDGANLIGVEITSGGNHANLTGTVYGYIIRDDDDTIVVEGTLTGGCMASITLPATAYAIPGNLSIVIKVGETTVGACVGRVYRAQTDTIADPTNIIPSVQDLLTRIQAALDAAEDAEDSKTAAAASAASAAADAETVAHYALQVSHVGMIIHTTALDTQEKVIAIYGGTAWTKLEGVFLLGASESHAVNSTGGAETVTLTTSQIPSHSHGYLHYNDSGSQGWIASGMIGSTTGGNGMRVDGSTAAEGGGGAHNNMPPYKTVYIWERTA